MTQCPLCNGALEIRRDRTYQFKFRGDVHTLDGLERLVCLGCGTGISSKDTAAHNQAAILAFQRSIAGEMAPIDVLALREKYGMSQEQAGRIFKTARRAFSKWERGEVAPNAGVANVLRLALDHPEYMRFMADKAGEHVDLPCSPQMVPHAELVALQEQLVRQEKDNHIRRRESYEAGMKEGQRRRIVMASWSSPWPELEAFGKSSFNDELPVSLMIWQKEKPRLSRQ